MRCLSDKIELYLKNLLEKNPRGKIEIQRRGLAETFQCVPSQINYVLETRFSLQSGYIVESQRGGGGYIRIIKVCRDEERDFLEEIYGHLGEEIEQRQAFHLLSRLEEEGFITSREAEICKTMMHRQILGINLPLRDILRARLLKGVVMTLMKHHE